MFVLDEADVMIDTQGFKDMSIKLHKELDLDTCQVLLFSATYDDEVMRFAKRVVLRPNIIRVSISLVVISIYWLIFPTTTACFHVNLALN